jgi:hypothetical protein
MLRVWLVRRPGSRISKRAVEVLDGVYDTGLAAALVDLGATLRRLKRRTESRVPLRRALEIAERIGSS